MRRSHRILAGACAAVAALAFTGAALATYSPKLVVSTAGGHARVGVLVGATDDATAKATIYIPNGYGVATPAPGTALGTVTATAAAADLGGAVLPLTGQLLAIAPTQTTIAASQACGVNPTQTWDMHLSAAGQTLDIPMFVVATVGPEAASGFVSKLVVCLPPPDVPVGTPGRSVFGAKLTSATFTSSAIAAPTSAGTFRWTSLWTPYNPGQGTANAAGSVETQALHTAPVTLSTKVTKKKATKGRTVVRVSSIVNGGAAAITTTANGRRVGKATATFTLARKKSAKIVVTARVDSVASVPTGTPVSPADLFYRDLGGSACVPTAIFQGLPCIDATSGGQTLVRRVTVR